MLYNTHWLKGFRSVINSNCKSNTYPTKDKLSCLQCREKCISNNTVTCEKGIKLRVLLHVPTSNSD